MTNIDEDGTVPPAEVPNWTVPRLNNFRQNVQPEGEFSAPDLVVSVTSQCFDGLTSTAQVRNIGQAAVPAGVVVGFYEGDPDQGGVLLGTGMTTKPLYPAEAQAVVLELDELPAAFIDGSKPLVVRVDDGGQPHAWQECRTDNNDVFAEPACKVIG